jgi:hypothetical protein
MSMAPFYSGLRFFICFCGNFAIGDKGGNFAIGNKGDNFAIGNKADDFAIGNKGSVKLQVG